MICQRCGWCCYAIPAHLPDGSFKPGGELCKFLDWDGIKAICSIRNYHSREEWLTTPCGKYTTDSHNPEQDPLKKARPCVIGTYVLERGGAIVFRQIDPSLAFAPAIFYRALRDHLRKKMEP